MKVARPQSLAEGIYQALKDEIWRFVLLPGDRFSEGDVAERLKVSRTPVRQALHRLEREGYVEVYFKSGWQVRLLDFAEFDDLYDIRIVLERAAVEKLCVTDNPACLEALNELRNIWCLAPEEQLTDGAVVADLDEAFHCALVAATGNKEMAKLHQQISERIRIVRRLDFTAHHRIDLTYQEHKEILEHIFAKHPDAQTCLTRHIEASKAQVRTFTLNRLEEARAPIHATGI